MITDQPDSAVAEQMISRLRVRRIELLERAHATNGVPPPMILEKHTDHLTPLLEEVINAAPLFLIATANGEGDCAVSPNGDPVGNRRVDGHRNIIKNPHVRLVSIIPNVYESLWVNCSVFLTDDAELLGSMAVQDPAPQLATIVEINLICKHFVRVFLRLHLWQPESWPDPM
jgi:predicted pyridoxine 5'-phosphate oxidase superfamily flavin-nucleotide-binding protein